MNIYVIITLAAAVALLAWRVTRFLRFWIAEGDKLYAETGHVVPKVSPTAAFFQHWLSWVACRVFVGPVTYMKNPLIDEWEGRLVTTPNHQCMGDILALCSLDARRPDGKRRI